MDMDEATSRFPPLIGYFDVSNDFFAWSAPRHQQIERRRAELGDVLIFDILLSSGGIREPDVLYPPSDVESLLRLLGAIESSNYDALKKECLIYFLLKWHQDGREDRFAMERCIPPHFTALADAYWYLDTGFNVPRAVSILADTRLNKDYVSKILQAISLAPQPTPLILKYVRTVKPPLTEPVDIDMYALALADSSLLEAWRFQRTFNEMNATRARILTKLIEWCIFPTPRRAALTTLLSLPLSPYEESILHAYALDPQPLSLSLPVTQSSPPPIPAASILVLRDLICVRLIQAGKYADAVKMDHQFASTTLDEQAPNQSQAQDRRRMVHDVYAALPAAERILLDAEIEVLGKGKGKATAALPNGTASSSHVNNVGDVDMSMSISHSWENIPRPSQTKQPQMNGHASTPFRDGAPSIPIPEHAGVTRSGGSLLLSTSKPAAAGPTLAQTPFIPISSSSSVPGLNGSLSSSRKSFPPLLSATLASSALSSSQHKPRQSLGFTQTPGKAAGGLLFGGTKFGSGSGSGASTSSATGAFPSLTSSSKVQPQPPQSFVSATRQRNAFYQPPPPPKVNGVKRPVEAGGGNSSAGAVDPDANMDMDMDVGHRYDDRQEADKNDELEDTHDRRTSRGQDHNMDIDDGVTLSFSVFGNRGRDNAPSGRTRAGVAHRDGKPRVSMEESAGRTTRKVPPGAFLSDEEDEVENNHMERAAPRPAPSPSPLPQVPVRPTKSSSTVSKPSTRTGTRHHPNPKEKDTEKSKPRLKTMKKIQARDLGRSLPGSLMDSDDEPEEEQEEHDHVAPLPARPSSPPRKAPPKGRSSVTSAGASDVGEDDHDHDGVQQTRQTRRSTRLAGSASAGALSAGRKSPEVEKVEKKKAAGTRGKKSTTAQARHIVAPPATTRRKR